MKKLIVFLSVLIGMFAITSCAKAPYRCLFSCEHKKLMKAEIVNVNAFVTNWINFMESSPLPPGVTGKAEQLGVAFIDETKTAIVKVKLTLSGVAEGEEQSVSIMGYLILINTPPYGWDIAKVVQVE